MKIRRAQLGCLAALATLAFLFLFAACGGGGGGDGAHSGPQPLSITTTSLNDAMVHKGYSAALSAGGGTSPHAWRLAANSSPLPPGLALASDGVISGVPTAEGTFRFTIEVHDGGLPPQSAQQSYSFTVVAELIIANDFLSTGIIDHPYSATLEATGGKPPYLWSMVPGPLEAGLTFSDSGVISGMPSELGSYDLHLSVTDSGSYTANRVSYTSSRVLTVSIVSPLSLNTTALPDTNVGVDYSEYLQASGGLRPWTFGLAPGSGPLPPGLLLDNSLGVTRIHGMPTTPGSYAFTLQVQDSGHPPQTDAHTIAIQVGNALYIRPVALPAGVVGQPYREGLMAYAYGGTPPYRWDMIGGSLPAAMSFESPAGFIAGTPAQVESAQFTVKVTDSASSPASATTAVGLSIRPPLSIGRTTLPDGALGRTYRSVDLNVVGGRPPLTGRIVAGALPTGLRLDPQGPTNGSFVITDGSGSSPVGLFPFTFQVIDSSDPPQSASRDFTIRINEPLEITTSSLPQGMTGDPYDAPIVASGGITPYSWSSLYGLPRGLVLDSVTGRLTGTPTEAWDSRPVTIGVRDSANYQQTSFQSYALTIIGRLSITTTSLPAGKPNAPYLVTLGLFSGRSPFVWNVSSGALPGGLILYSATGQISGTPTTEETQTFTVRVSDAGPPAQTASRTLTLRISRSLGRNDSIVTATPISNGTVHASLSPYADPIDGPANPDNDYYQLTANPGAVVTVETFADRLSAPSTADTVIEILDASGARIASCTSNNQNFPFDKPCGNDDITSGVELDSRLQFQVPGTSGNPVTFYVHVLDWSGSARPDFLYDLQITGAN